MKIKNISIAIIIIAITIMVLPLLPARALTTDQIISQYKYGQTNSQILQLQRDLSAKGYFGGPFTGFYGPKTKAAVDKYLAARASAKATAGKVTASTIDQIIAKYKFGQTHKDVLQLQKELSAKKYFGGPFTGFYGLKTKAAVEKYLADKKAAELATKLKAEQEAAAKALAAKEAAELAAKNPADAKPLFNDVAYVAYDGKNYYQPYYADQVLPLASLSKLMTALVILDHRPDWNKNITITKEEINYPYTLQATGTTSEVPLRPGDQARFYDLWVAMLVASSNQSAVILSDNVGISRQQFVREMNDKAAALGLTQTKFLEMSGLSEKNISTAKEFAIIAAAAFNKIEVLEASRLLEYGFTVTQGDGAPRLVSVINRNLSLMAFNPDGAKTGFLVEAQRNATIKKNGRIIVVLHALSMNQRNDTVKKLLAGEQVSFNYK